MIYLMDFTFNRIKKKCPYVKHVDFKSCNTWISQTTMFLNKDFFNMWTFKGFNVL
jgi:hypothetical protein